MTKSIVPMKRGRWLALSALVTALAILFVSYVLIMVAHKLNRPHTFHIGWGTLWPVGQAIGTWLGCIGIYRAYRWLNRHSPYRPPNSVSAEND